MSDGFVKQNALNFTLTSLRLDAYTEINRIVEFLRDSVHYKLHRQGVVLGISGGIDSSVCLALCVKAFGVERVIGILLPEKESNPESVTLALKLADKFQVQTISEDITQALEGYGCYRRRNEAIQRIFPNFRPGWNVKIVLPGDLLEHGTLKIFKLVVKDPSGNEFSQRLPLKEYYQIVASSNFKQRTRTNFLYYHAEARNYAVVGTPNKNEHDLGFFVKYGDGGYDVAPIRHLFKSQIYQLATFLEIPESICRRSPTTDTYPGGGTQEEFFFRLPFSILDSIWLCYENGLGSSEIAGELEMEEAQVERVILDIINKEKTTTYLRTQPIGIQGSKKHS